MKMFERLWRTYIQYDFTFEKVRHRCRLSSVALYLWNCGPTYAFRTNQTPHLSVKIARDRTFASVVFVIIYTLIVGEYETQEKQMNKAERREKNSNAMGTGSKWSVRTNQSSEVQLVALWHELIPIERARPYALNKDGTKTRERGRQECFFFLLILLLHFYYQQTTQVRCASIGELLLMAVSSARPEWYRSRIEADRCKAGIAQVSRLFLSGNTTSFRFCYCCFSSFSLSFFPSYSS